MKPLLILDGRPSEIFESSHIRNAVLVSSLILDSDIPDRVLFIDNPPMSAESTALEQVRSRLDGKKVHYIKGGYCEFLSAYPFLCVHAGST
jgi:hypothetical protein